MKPRSRGEAASIWKASARARSELSLAQHCSIWGFSLHDKQQLLSPSVVRDHTREAG